MPTNQNMFLLIASIEHIQTPLCKEYVGMFRPRHQARTQVHFSSVERCDGGGGSV